MKPQPPPSGPQTLADTVCAGTVVTAVTCVATFIAGTEFAAAAASTSDTLRAFRGMPGSAPERLHVPLADECLPDRTRRPLTPFPAAGTKLVLTFGLAASAGLTQRIGRSLRDNRCASFLRPVAVAAKGSSAVVITAATELAAAATASAVIVVTESTGVATGTTMTELTSVATESVRE